MLLWTQQPEIKQFSGLALPRRYDNSYLPVLDFARMFGRPRERVWAHIYNDLGGGGQVIQLRTTPPSHSPILLPLGHV